MNQFYMIDLDGTMYQGRQIIESAKTFIDECLLRNQPFLFLTNNSSRTQRQAAEHMLKIGYQGIKPEHFYTSAMAAADTAAKLYPMRRAYYIGEQGMREALEKRGFILDEEHPDFVFIGLNRHAGYEDYSRAVRHILNGAVLVGTNNDRILLSEKGANIGNGSVVAMFEYCTSRPALKIGKPYAPIFDAALAYCKAKREEVVILGDNLETDIQCGINAGVKTVLVTTGVHQRSDIERLNIVPDRVVDSLMELL